MKKQSVYTGYLQQKKPAASFFAHPLQADWKNVAGHINRAEQRRIFIDLLYQQNKNSDDASISAALRKMAEKPPLFVVTGQQLGLFVSPMYTVYKTLSAILLAEEIQRRLPHYSVLPLFWLESEDHDFAEVASLNVWTKEGTLSRFSLPERENEQNRSMGRRVLPPQINPLIDELEKALQPTEFSAALFSLIRDNYQPGRGWAEAFTGVTRRLFRGNGLLVFNPGAEAVKKASEPFFQQLIRQNDALLRAFAIDSESLKKAGYALQVHLRKNLAYIYLSEKGGARQHIYRENNGRFISADRQKGWNEAELIHYLHDHPDWFSSTVLTRPLWQSWMLPVISYVAGAAEIAYWAMLKNAFSLLNIPMPQLQPRASFTLVEPAVRRLLQKLQIDPNTVTEDKQSFIRGHFQRTEAADWHKRLQTTQSRIRQEQDNILRSLKELDITLLPAAQKAFGQIEKNMEQLETKILKRLEEKEQRLSGQLARVQEHFFPFGKKQERVIGSVYFLNKYGFGWVERLKEQIDIHNPETRWFYL